MRKEKVFSKYIMNYESTEKGLEIVSLLDSFHTRFTKITKIIQIVLAILTYLLNQKKKQQKRTM